MPQENEVLRLFERTEAYMQGHFQLSSGLHSANYLQSALVLRYPEFAEILGNELARHLATLVNDSPHGNVVDLIYFTRTGVG